MTTQAIPTEQVSSGKAFRLPASNSATWPLAAIAVLLAMQLSMVFTRAVNWDEFWFYYHVAEFSRGNLAQPLQSLHVRLFAWLPGLPGNSVDKIVTARLVMLACEACTLAAIYAIARRFVDRPVAILAALLYISAGFVLQHGFSFRTDPMATAALMGALAILCRCRLTVLPLAAFAVLVAVAGMITMKVALFAPVFLGMAWMRWSDERFRTTSALRLVGAAVVTVAIFALLYTWHATALTQQTEGTEMAAGASGWMFFIGVPPYWQMMLKGVLIALPLFALALWTPRLLWQSDRSRAEKLALAGLWFPLLIPFFYTNTAPYFYAFSLAPVAVSVVLAAERLVGHYDLRKVSMVLLVLGGVLFTTEDRQTMQRQSQVVDAADTIITEPVASFDFDGMIARFTKANDFLTPWGLAQYAQRGTPVYRETMEREAVPVLLANAEVLQRVMAGQPSPFGTADVAALRGNYIHHWGPFYVAGKQVDAATPVDEEFLVPGTYTLVEGQVSINGRALGEGETVAVSRGSHQLQGIGTLRWGVDLGTPEQQWTDGPLYVDF